MARTNLSELCLTYEQMQMHGTELEKYLQRYLFPCVAIFGILGNALNLTVLLNRSMRSRANTFLALLAISDIAFLSLLVPNILANYPIFTFNYYFRFFYLNAKVHLLSFANWSSAVAIWSVIAVCADRLIGIRRPLYTRSDWRGYRMLLLISAMVLLTGTLTLYQHVAYKCLVRSYCHGSQLYSKCLPVSSPKWFGKQPNPYSRAFRNFIDVSTMLYVVLIIICPIVLLTVLNILLLCSLRKRTKKLVFGKDDASRVTIDGMAYQKTEQRVTLTVALIVTMFTVTNGPSALIHLLSTVYQIRLQDWYDITLIGSTLVICGKASNFILFCLCSKHFRNRLFALTQKKMHSKLDTITVRLIDRRKDSHSATHSRRFSVASDVPRKERSRSLAPASQSQIQLQRPVLKQ